MKKLICALMAALLCCLTVFALAEAPIGDFDHFWIALPDGNEAVEIRFDGEGWRVTAARYADEEYFTVAFDRCFYDENQNALICEGGVLARGALAAGEEETVEVEPYPAGAAALKSAKRKEQAPEAVASGFGAALTVDEDGLLHWTGSGDAWADQVYANGDYEDDGLFVGEWECGDAWISVSLRGGVYDVFVSLNVNHYETHIWQYACALDENGRLTGTGGKVVEIYDEAAEEFVETVIYTDGGVTFALDGDALLWNDAMENAGEGMAFTRIAAAENGED